jgi:hypothetical protein
LPHVGAAHLDGGGEADDIDAMMKKNVMIILERT